MVIGIDASRAAVAARTGTEAYALNLIQAIINAAAGEHTIRLYFNQAPKPDLFSWGHNAHVEPIIIPMRRLWTHVRLAAELNKRSPDVFFTPAHVIPLTYFGPAVATVHDLGYHFFPKAHTRSQVAYLKWSTKHNARRSRLVLADSLATKDDLIEQYGIAADKVHVVYPGVDPQFLAEAMQVPSSPASRVSPRVTHNPEPYLVYISTIQPRKNIARILKAFESLADTIPHRLILGGRVGWQADFIMQVYRAMPTNIQERIEFRGYVPESEKVALISGADALIYPSLYEGFGFPLLEGNACGIPVLAANSSSLPELAGNGAALLVNPADTSEIARGMLRIIDNAALRDQLITAGYQNIKRFSWKTAAQQTLDILLSAARSSRKMS